MRRAMRYISAPMEGVSDRTARALWHTLGADATTSEAVLVEDLVRLDEVAWHKATADAPAVPTIVQLVPPPAGAPGGLEAVRALASMWRDRAPVPLELQLTLDVAGCALPYLPYTPAQQQGQGQLAWPTAEGASAASPAQRAYRSQQGELARLHARVAASVSDFAGLDVAALTPAPAPAPVPTLAAPSPPGSLDALLLRADELGAMADALRRALCVPVSLKLRLPGATPAERERVARALLPRLRFDSVTLHAAATTDPGALPPAAPAGTGGADAPAVPRLLPHAADAWAAVGALNASGAGPEQDLYPELAVADAGLRQGLVRMSGALTGFEQIAALHRVAVPTADVAAGAGAGAGAGVAWDVDAVVLGRGLLVEPRLCMALREEELERAGHSALARAAAGDDAQARRERLGLDAARAGDVPGLAMAHLPAPAPAPTPGSDPVAAAMLAAGLRHAEGLAPRRACVSLLSALEDYMRLVLAYHPHAHAAGAVRLLSLVIARAYADIQQAAARGANPQLSARELPPRHQTPGHAAALAGAGSREAMRRAGNKFTADPGAGAGAGAVAGAGAGAGSEQPPPPPEVRLPEERAARRRADRLAQRTLPALYRALAQTTGADVSVLATGLATPAKGANNNNSTDTDTSTSTITGLDAVDVAALPAAARADALRLLGEIRACEEVRAAAERYVSALDARRVAAAGGHPRRVRDASKAREPPLFSPVAADALRLSPARKAIWGDLLAPSVAAPTPEARLLVGDAAGPRAPRWDAVTANAVQAALADWRASMGLQGPAQAQGWLAGARHVALLPLASAYNFLLHCGRHLQQPAPDRDVQSVLAPAAFARLET